MLIREKDSSEVLGLSLDIFRDATVAASCRDTATVFGGDVPILTDQAVPAIIGFGRRKGQQLKGRGKKVGLDM